jgi:hypothetical protein
MPSDADDVWVTHYVRFRPKTDMGNCTAHVRFRGYSLHDLLQRICLILPKADSLVALHMSAYDPSGQ